MHEPDHDHGPRLELARNDLGSITACACGAVTLNLHCLSIRFQPAALGELEDLLAAANARLRVLLQDAPHGPASPLMSIDDGAPDGGDVTPCAGAVH